MGSAVRLQLGPPAQARRSGSDQGHSSGSDAFPCAALFDLTGIADGHGMPSK